MGLNTSLPVYVTRKTANGQTASYSCPAWMPIFAVLLFLLNVIVWGGIGLYEAGRLIVG